MKCQTPNCTNQTHEGEFVGDFCAPCHSYNTGKGSKFSQAYRNAMNRPSLNDLEMVYGFDKNGNIDFNNRIVLKNGEPL